jgi:nitrogen regulatory protein P-II 1
MFRIEAILQPDKLEAVKEALKEISISGLTVSDVRGHGRQKGHTEFYRGREYNVDLLPKVKLEMVVPSDRKDEVIRVVSSTARSGRVGDGKIFVSEISEAIRIRDDARGDGAL